jgi:mono/diheme cytochrome c family protein
VCHGENAVGGGVVPDLRASSFLGNDFFYEIVLNGAMKDNGMAPFKSILDHQKAESIRAYLIHRASEDKRAEAASQDVHAGEGRKLPIGLEFKSVTAGRGAISNQAGNAR